MSKISTFKWRWRVVQEWLWQWPWWWWWWPVFYDMVMWRGPELYTNDDGAVPAAAQTSLPVASRPSNFKSGKSALDFELTCTLLYLLRGTARHTGEISVQGLLCSTPEFYFEFFSGVYSRVYPPERQSTTGSLSLSRPPPRHLPLAQRTHIPHNLRSCCFLFGRWSERISKGTQLTLFSDQYEIF